MSKIADNCFGKALEASLNPQISSQRFTYFARGVQSFSFLSEDGNYVLKIFNNRYQRELFWLKAFSLPNLFDAWRVKRLSYLEGKLKKTMESYRLAFEELNEETALLFLHPAKTSHLQTEITIVDKLGIEHRIDLDQTGFLIQKKAELAYPHLTRLKEAQDIEGAKASLSSLVQLFKTKQAKGIDDSDPLIRTNFGFIGNRAIQIDVGPLFYGRREHPEEELARIMASLNNWLQAHFPQMIPHLEQEINQEIGL